MKKQFLLFLLALLLSLNSCKNTDNQKIIIGFSGNLTGRISDLGTSARNGFELAVEQINDNGGVKGRLIHTIIKDDKNDPMIGRTVDNELLNAGVIAVIGHLLSSSADSAIELFNREKVPLISPTISSEKFSNIDDYFLKIMTDTKFMGEALAELAINNCNSVVGIYELKNKSHSQKVFESFQTKFVQLGGKIEKVFTFSSGESDLFKLAEEIARYNTKGVVSIASGFDNAILCQKLVNINPGVLVFAGQWAMTDDLVEKGGKSLENIRITGIMDLNSKSTDFIKFRNSYIDRYNEEPAFSSMCAYESVQIIAKVLNNMDNIDSPDISERLKNAILKQKVFAGLIDKIEINSFGDANRKLSIFTVRDRKFVKL